MFTAIVILFTAARRLSLDLGAPHLRVGMSLTVVADKLGVAPSRLPISDERLVGDEYHDACQIAAEEKGALAAA